MAPPRMRVVAFRATPRLYVARLLAAAPALVVLACGLAWDRVRRRTSEQARAARLGAAVRRIGGTLVRVAKRLAVPTDLLPSAYGDVISALSDEQPPMPAAAAIAAVEKAIRAPLEAVFARFDPVPILSSSISCTYQALLLDGTKVVAKVRRPGAGERLAVDLDLFDLVCRALEFLTVVRQDVTREFRRQLRVALVDELDFEREARHQAMFRRAARRSGKRFFTAPRVYFALSSDDVLVQEFVSGMWLSELLAAARHGDERITALAARLGVDPARVASRLLWISAWTWYDNAFFMAEPSPYNIIVGEHGRLWFIDFTSTGPVDRSIRQALQQNMYYALQEDPLNMARASLALLEPLPPLDVLELTKVLEISNWQMLYACAGRRAGRPQRPTTLIQWRGLMAAARRFRIAPDLGVVRLLRAIATYEAMALELDADAHPLRSFKRFIRDRANRAADPTGPATRRRIAQVFDRTVYLKLERMANAGETIFFRLRHLVTLPHVNFHALTSKSSFTFVVLMRFLSHVALLTVTASAAVHGYGIVNGSSESFGEVVQTVVRTVAYQAALVVLLAINGRALLFRLDDSSV